MPIIGAPRLARYRTSLEMTRNAKQGARIIRALFQAGISFWKFLKAVTFPADSSASLPHSASW
jgi:hypothetical protein